VTAAVSIDEEVESRGCAWLAVVALLSVLWWWAECQSGAGGVMSAPPARSAPRGGRNHVRPQCGGLPAPDTACGDNRPPAAPPARQRG
jgi:hypothetical protein